MSALALAFGCHLADESPRLSSSDGGSAGSVPPSDIPAVACGSDCRMWAPAPYRYEAWVGQRFVWDAKARLPLGQAVTSVDGTLTLAGGAPAVVDHVFTPNDIGEQTVTFEAHDAQGTEVKTLSVEVVDRPAIRNTHPRVWLDATRLADMREDRQKGALEDDWHATVRFADEMLSGKTDALKPTTSAPHNLTALMLVGLISGDDRYLDKAKDIALDVASRPAHGGNDQLDRAYLALGGLAYDWLYDRLTENEKTELEDDILERALASETMQKNYDSPKIGGHDHSVYEWSLVGLLGIYHERAEARQLVDELILPRLLDHYWTWISFLMGDDGGLQFGWFYSRGYLMSAIAGLDALATATGVDVYRAVYPDFVGAGAFVLSGLTGPGNHFRNGDNNRARTDWRDAAVAGRVATAYGDPTAAKAWEIAFAADDWVRTRWRSLLWRRHTDMPSGQYPAWTSRHHRRTGQVTMRRDWDLSTPVALFNASPYWFNNHWHRDANSFEIAHRGPLLLDSGHYDNYRTEHHNNYSSRTIAHNTIVVFDPDECFQLQGRGACLSNDGGQRIDVAPPRTVDDLLQGAPAAQIRSFVEGPGFQYVLSDAAESYGEKMTRFDRHFLYLHDVEPDAGGRFVVFDQVDATAEARFLLHSAQKPSRQGNEVEVRTDDAAARVTFVVPGDVSIDLIGGPGKEFWVDGTNYDDFRGSSRAPREHAGAWRAEAYRAQGDGPQRFLTAIYAGEAGVSVAPDVEPVGVDHGYGVAFGDTVVAFADDADTVRFRSPRARVLVFGGLDRDAPTVHVDEDGAEPAAVGRGWVLLDDVQQRDVTVAW
ncbi:MAG: heparinase II/III family protein [Myxococcota bacterium]